jgi:hypothetical protein
MGFASRAKAERWAMIVLPDDNIQVRELARRTLADGRGVRTYYRLLSQEPCLLRVEGSAGYAELVRQRQPFLALFNMDGIDYQIALQDGIPLPQSWVNKKIIQVSLRPLGSRDKGRPVLLSQALAQKGVVLR